MKLFTTPVLCFVMLFVASINMQAQTSSDDIMMKKGEACLAVDYNTGSWDQYWEGTYLRSNGNVQTLHRTAITPMVAVGLHKKVNLLIATPYVQTQSSDPNGGKQAGAKGFQDIAIDLKVKWLNLGNDKSRLSFLTNFGFATPISNYLSDYAPYSIGLGTRELSARGILQYKLGGLYLRGAVAHLWRGETEIERDYYYNNGSYYTNLMDVPNAWNYHGVLGIWLFDNSLKIQANYMGIKSTSGDDIRAYNAGQPTNKVEFEQAGALAHYYFKGIKGLGLYGYYNQVFSGRNMGKFTSFGGGVTYQFNILNNNEDEN